MLIIVKIFSSHGTESLSCRRVAVFLRKPLSRLTFLKVVCLLADFVKRLKKGYKVSRVRLNEERARANTVIKTARLLYFRSESSLAESNCQLAYATWFGGLNLMIILLIFADSLNFKRVGKGTVFTQSQVKQEAIFGLSSDRFLRFI